MEHSKTSLEHLQLSPMVTYYLRKLLRQNLDRLKFIVASGAGLKADPLADINQVITSLYLDESEIKGTLQKLESLTVYHQKIASQEAKNHKELAEIEEEIFWLLGFKLEKFSHQGRLMLVDDSPENLKLLSIALSQYGYEVRSAINGAMALKNVHEVSPDLILLDIMMPGMDGFETCQRLKTDEKVSDIPVIFISAIDDVQNKVKAFEVGGVDYITKPFQFGEVLARVNHQLKIRQLQKRLEEQNIRLQKENYERLRVEGHLRQEQEKLESLFFRIFPKTIASQFPAKTEYLTNVNAEIACVESFENATVLLAQVSQTAIWANRMSPGEFVGVLNGLFSQFNQLCESLELETIKISGETYCVVGGVPQAKSDSVDAIADLALGMQKVMTRLQEEEKLGLTLQIGIDTGNVLGGVVQGKQIRYDLWGNTIHIAHQIQSQAIPGTIEVNLSTYKHLKSKYDLVVSPNTFTFGGDKENQTYWLVGKTS
jgi:DNA-binding response OmpR family regulator/class 3 adenylate cyclase